MNGNQMPAAPARSRWDQVPVWLFVGGMVLSYVTLFTFAVAIGFDPRIAWIFPLIVDGFILYAAREASEAAAAGHRAARWWAWSMVVLWTGVSAGLQALDAVHLGTAAMAGHMVPPVVMLCAWEMRLRRATRHATQRPHPTSQPPTDAGGAHPQLRAEVRDQLAATLRAEVAAELRGMVAGELSAIRAELQRATSPAIPAPATVTARPLPATAEAPEPTAPPAAATADTAAPATPGDPDRPPPGDRDHPTPAARPPAATDRDRTAKQPGQRSPAETEARLWAVYQQNPAQQWTQRTLAEAAGIGRTRAGKFLREVRDTATQPLAEVTAPPAAATADTAAPATDPTTGDRAAATTGTTSDGDRDRGTGLDRADGRLQERER